MKKPTFGKKKNKKDSGKVKINLPRTKVTETNEYYLTVSERFRTAKLIAVFVLAGFLISMLAAFRSNITYDNLTYLLKDLDTDVASEIGTFSTVKYDEQPKCAFGMYKGRLAAVGTTSFMLFNSAGSLEFDYSAALENPQIEVSDKYVLAYDLGGKNYCLYTTLARVLGQQSDFEIQGAAVGDDGSFALVTRSRESKYVVSVYNSNFKNIANYYKDKYVTDIALSPDANQLVIVSADTDGSSISGEVMVCEIGTERAKTRIIEDAMPLHAEYFESSDFAVISDNAVSFFDSDGDEFYTYRISGMTLSTADISKTRCAIVCNENLVGSQNRIIIFDFKANILYNEIIEAGVSYIACADDNFAYVVTTDSIVNIDSTGKKTQFAYSGNIFAVLPISKTALICTPSSAYVLDS